MTDALEALRWRDDLLQVLYWFRGEGLGESVPPAELVVLLGAEEELIAYHLERMAAEGYVERVDRSGYRLTERGVKEGGRRFADEFAGLTGQAHGECNNPNCSCHTLGPEACDGRHVHTD